VDSDAGAGVEGVEEGTLAEAALAADGEPYLTGFGVQVFYSLTDLLLR
jgi:hypothetical protein